MIYLKITQHPTKAERQAQRRQVKRMKVYCYGAVAWLLFTGFCWGITPFCFQYAEMWRGYQAIGGEIFVPLLPLFLYPLFNGVCDMIITMKGWDEK